MRRSEIVTAAIQKLDLIEQKTATLPEAIAKVEDAIVDTKVLSAECDTPEMSLLRELFQGILALMQKPG